MNDILKALNSEQKKAVEIVKGPLLVLAGAGSGKTRTIIHRAAYLIKEKKINPWNLLIVTFTNKAARELQERLEDFFQISTRSLWVGTFHSICLRILRFENKHLNSYENNFTIYDTQDQKTTLKKCYKDLDIDKKQFPLNAAKSIISRNKNNLTTPENFFLYNKESFKSRLIQKIYQKYQKKLLNNNAMDFDDLIMNATILLKNNKEILEKYRSIFKYIMIDEYQDTNYAQFKLINLLAREHQNICAVGDDDQAIYGWRGATIKNILNFGKDYQNVKTIRLEQNYRSTQPILEVANQLIKNNKDRHEKKLWSDMDSSDKPELNVFENETDEANFVAEDIKSIQMNKNVSFNNFAVLYRTNAQSRIFEKAFIKNNLPFQVFGGVNFFQRKEVKDILAYLRILTNPEDNESFLRIINFPKRGIGKKSVSKVLDFSLKNNLNLYDSIIKIPKVTNLPNLFKKKIGKLSKLLDKWENDLNTKNALEMMETVIEDTGILKIYDKSDDSQDISRSENIEQLLVSAQEFVDSQQENTNNEDLETYLQNISLLTDIDNFDEDSSTVKLMTMHNAKGLEFDYVYIVGIEENLLPHHFSSENKKEIEEERRLLYVAITRSKKISKLSYARFRRHFGSVRHTAPSRFLKEIPSNLLTGKEENVYEYYQPKRKQRKKKRIKKFVKKNRHFKIGQNVYHKKFGQGTVLNVEGTEKNAKLTVSFRNGNLKKILGSYLTTDF